MIGNNMFNILKNRIFILFLIFFISPYVCADKKDILEKYIGLSWNSSETDVAKFAFKYKATVKSSHDVRGYDSKLYYFDDIIINSIGKVSFTIIVVQNHIENFSIIVEEKRKKCYQFDSSQQPPDCLNNKNIITKIARNNVRIINSIIGNPNFRSSNINNSSHFDVFWNMNNAYVKLFLNESDFVELGISITRKTNYLKSLKNKIESSKSGFKRPIINGVYKYSEYFPIHKSTFKSSDLSDIESLEISLLTNKYFANKDGFGRTCDKPKYSYSKPVDEHNAFMASALSGGKLIPLAVINVKCPGDDYFTASYEIFSEYKIGWYFNGYYIFFKKHKKHTN